MRSDWDGAVRVVLLACLLTAPSWNSLAQTQPPPPMVEVELAVTGADGRPVADAEAVIKVTGRVTFSAPTPDIVTHTDSQGVAHFQAPAGSYRLSVLAGGAYGSVGTTEFTPGRIARPKMARMVPYGSLDGTYDVQRCQSDVVIHGSGGALAKYKFEPVDGPPPPDPVTSKPGTAMMGMGGISSQAGGASQLQGKVFLADGITPALGAQVLYWRPTRRRPHCSQ